MGLENNCSGICNFFNPENDKTTTFRKYCPICNTHMIAKYSSYPCCHSKTTSAQ